MTAKAGGSRRKVLPLVVGERQQEAQNGCFVTALTSPSMIFDRIQESDLRHRYNQARDDSSPSSVGIRSCLAQFWGDPGSFGLCDKAANPEHASVGKIEPSLSTLF
jgi:hypothetical protein